MAICALFLVAWLAWLAQFAGAGARDEDAPSTDFVVYWLASDLTLHGAPELAYDPEALNAGRNGVAGDATDAWLYPPVALLFVLPLALLPLAGAFAAWVVATGAVLISAVRRIWPGATLTWLALAFPATMFNAINGQSGLLAAGLFAWGMVLLRGRPVVAGAVLGLLAFKPQFLPLVLIALLAGGRRRALVATLGSAGAFTVVSVLALGVEPWRAFIDGVPETASMVYDGVSPLQKMQSVTAMLLLTGSGDAVAKAAQALVLAGCAGFIAWLWRRDAAFEYKAAGLGLAVLLATPYVYHYDLALLGVAMLFYGARAQASGWRRWDREALALAWLTPLLGFVLGSVTSVIIGPFVFLALGALVARRVQDERQGLEEKAAHLALAA
jgi:hypothetical protein